MEEADRSWQSPERNIACCWNAAAWSPNPRHPEKKNTQVWLEKFLAQKSHPTYIALDVNVSIIVAHPYRRVCFIVKASSQLLQLQRRLPSDKINHVTRNEKCTVSDESTITLSTYAVRANCDANANANLSSDRIT